MASVASGLPVAAILRAPNGVACMKLFRFAALAVGFVVGWVGVTVGYFVYVAH